MWRAIFTTLLLCFNVMGQDSEFSNLKSGISVIWQGERGSDYAEEYFYFDKRICDRKVVYIKEGTKILLKHNERNIARISGGGSTYAAIGANGKDGIPNSGDEGIIRYRIDGDLNWAGKWCDDGLTNLVVYKAFTNQFSFSELSYDFQVPVVGSIGPRAGFSMVNAYKDKYYHMGMADSFGDEWHTITVADDDWKMFHTDPEWAASDGKVILCVVNPKTACLTVRASGTGQFYTTPPKTYFVPKIFNQTTYVSLGTNGTVYIDLIDLHNRNLYYRITSAGDTKSSFIALTNSFIGIDASGLKDGNSELEYYVEGAGPGNIKSRLIVKNPPHPSLGEIHGNLVLGSSNTWQDIKQKYTTPTFKGRFDYDSKNRTGQETWAATYLSGTRFVNNYALANAFYASVLGIDSKRTAASSKTYMQYAKEMILDNSSSIDSVGAEMAQNQTSLPTRETIYRGYWDTKVIYSICFAYDILVNVYRSDQVKGGITPIEDYYLRDCMARWVREDFLISGNYKPSKLDTRTGGMWDTARRCASLVCMYTMPSYSTKYFGTSGLDGSLAQTEWDPFPNTCGTWKNFLLDNNIEPTGYPNLSIRGLGIEEYNISESGHFIDRFPYFDLMGPNFFIAANMMYSYSETNRLPRLEFAMNHAVQGQLLGLQNGSGPGRNSCLMCLNSRFGDLYDIGYPIITNLPSSNLNSEASALSDGGVFSFVWYKQGK